MDQKAVKCPINMIRAVEMLDEGGIDLQQESCAGNLMCCVEATALVTLATGRLYFDLLMLLVVAFGVSQDMIENCRFTAASAWVFICATDSICSTLCFECQVLTVMTLPFLLKPGSSTLLFSDR